jgi:N6-adenosine-specific RNA methylase IME4
MTLKEIRELPVSDIAAENCTLFLWATDPLLPQALDLMRRWGFNYKTIAFVWAKLNKNAPATLWIASDFFTGMGYWSRANSELCLLGTKGKRNDNPRV